MNTPNQTPRDLDQFETALLTELREHVATRPAIETVAAPVPHRRHYGRWAVGFAVAAAAATAVVIASPGGPGASPAYAVSESADGDVVVTIHRLEDSAGLEAALRDKGIDADVSFASHDRRRDHHLTSGRPAMPERRSRAARRRTSSTRWRSGGGGEVQQAAAGQAGRVPRTSRTVAAMAAEPATLTHEGDDWVLRIPADSTGPGPARVDRHWFGRCPRGRLRGNEAGLFCAFMSV